MLASDCHRLGAPAQPVATNTERMRSLLTTLRPQAENYRAVNKSEPEWRTLHRGFRPPVFSWLPKAGGALQLRANQPVPGIYENH